MPDEIDRPNVVSIRTGLGHQGTETTSTSGSERLDKYLEAVRELERIASGGRSESSEHKAAHAKK